MSDEQRLEELRRWADEQVPTAVPWVRDRVRLLLALVADLQRVLGDLCEESDAAAEALRYRRALEEIAAGRVTVAGGAEPMLGVDAAWVAREALAGRGDAAPVVNLLGRLLPRG